MVSVWTIRIFVGLAVAYAAVRWCPARWRLLLWIGVIVFRTVPWTGLQSDVRWDRITWMPFSSEVTSFRPRDVLVNLLLYWPLGRFLRGDRSSSLRLTMTACCLGLALSLCAESLQAFSRRRFPSATDVAMNAAGAALGAMAIGRRGRANASR